jgi:hypothetical protein
MEFVINELSIHGQFPSALDAQQTLKKLLAWRDRITREGLVLRSTRMLLDRPFTPTDAVRDVIKSCRDHTLRLRILNWLAKDGPYWDQEPLHGHDDHVECADEVITGSGIAEAAFAVARGHEREVLSVAPSSWERSPLFIDWIRSDTDRQTVSLENVWQEEQLARRLELAQREVASWTDLADWARRACPNIVLASDVVAPLSRTPFVPGAARRFEELLATLDRVERSFDHDGKLTAAGMQTYQDHFVGEKAWFSDSSDAEKVDFKREMTFPHPERPNERLFCPWHGKVKIQQMRVHFSHPITKLDPLFVVYMGPKITRR